MEFYLSTRKVGEVIVVDMSGRLIEGEPASLLRDTVRRFVADGNRKFILDLGGVSFINSCGLNALTAIRCWMDERGGKVSLLHLTRRVREVLEITQLVKVFDRFDDEEEAIRSFNAVGVPE